jgi:C4-dicarboxylate-specific signal transduction histidine kinase
MASSVPSALDDRPALARRVLDALPLTIYSVDLDGRITAANAMWSRFAADSGAVELAAEREVIGCSIYDAMADEGARGQIRRAMELLRDDRIPTVRWEFPCSSPDEERIFLMHISALRGPEGVEGYVFSTVDISAIHRSREALIETGIALSHAIDVARVYEEVSRQVRRAFPSIGVVIAVADDETAEIRIVHRWGYAGEGTSAALQARLTPDWLQALADGRIVRQGEPAPGTTLEITVPLTSSEGVLGAITLATDSLRSAQELEEAERVLSVIAAQTAVAIERAWLVRRVEHKRRLEAIGEVAAGVAHELRNPLFGISSAAQLLRFRAREDPVVEKNVTRILREVERLNKMVTSLLDFGRPAAVHLAPGDPELLWDDVLDLERERLAQHGLQLRRVRPRHGVRCQIDLEQLKQVYLNILVNAVDAAPAGSELVLHSTVLPNGSWRCRLTNGGPAIPPEVLPHVFEFFYSTKPGGTGIGLALCQRIMDEHGGSITIDSTPESGTSVTITLPPTAAT